MKAAVAQKAGEIEIKEVKTPSMSGGEVLLKTEYTAICSTDVKIFTGQKKIEYLDFPIILGHEIVGEVIEVGPDHKKFSVGDHLVPLLAKRALNSHIEDQIFKAVKDMESRAKAFGVDMRGGQPTGGNIKGGLTTIEDKSLGAISKGGTKQIQGILEYGERPSIPGLFFMDSPGREIEFLTGVAAAGCQIILFSTGLGAPQGFPTVPVINISGD